MGDGTFIDEGVDKLGEQDVVSLNSLYINVEFETAFSITSSTKIMFSLCIVTYRDSPS